MEGEKYSVNYTLLHVCKRPLVLEKRPNIIRRQLIKSLATKNTGKTVKHKRNINKKTKCSVHPQDVNNRYYIEKPLNNQVEAECHPLATNYSANATYKRYFERNLRLPYYI